MANKPILSTQADLASSQTAGAPALVMPTGVVLPFAGTAAPTGWLACDGTAISRTTYASLFAAISTSYGVGDGSTTFNLPDLRGRFPRFNDAMFGGSAAGRDSGRVLGSAQTDQNKAHTHTQLIAFNGNPAVINAAGSGSASRYQLSSTLGTPTGYDDVGVNTSGGAETRPINLAINAIIKV